MISNPNKIDNTSKSPEIQKLFDELRIGHDAIQNEEVYTVEEAFTKVRTTLEKEFKEHKI